MTTSVSGETFEHEVFRSIEPDLDHFLLQLARIPRAHVREAAEPG